MLNARQLVVSLFAALAIATAAAAHADPVPLATPTCQAGQTNCSGVCTNMTFDPNNCGRCAMACSLAHVSTAACVQGACAVVTCNAGFGNCDGNAANGCEDNTSSDAKNCGGCGIVCASANASSSCSNATCGMTCNSGFSNCNGNALDGCEANLGTDSRNCGACGHTCAGACAGGLCRL